jgi:hypothetical protein
MADMDGEGSLEGLYEYVLSGGVSGDGIQEICKGTSRSYKTDEKEERYDFEAMGQFCSHWRLMRHSAN